MYIKYIDNKVNIRGMYTSVTSNRSFQQITDAKN